MTNRVPVEPFQNWIEKRISRYEQQYMFAGERWGSSDAVQRVSFDLGIPVRRLHSYRTGSKQTKVGGKSIEVPAGSFRRDRVEEMLWRAGYFLWDVYSMEEFPGLYEEEKPRKLGTKIEPKPCQGCGEQVPLRKPSGKRLGVVQYAAKKFCCRECYIAQCHEVPLTPTVAKKCEECGEVIRRKRSVGGRWEDPGVFRARKFCSRQCSLKRARLAA